jgi:hypothetical protein
VSIDSNKKVRLRLSLAGNKGVRPMVAQMRAGRSSIPVTPDLYSQEDGDLRHEVALLPDSTRGQTLKDQNIDVRGQIAV